ncbi:MAG: hypothetical protein NZ898_12715 [Myxococcota bacterium]|nr:hypothetical protein [Myxococcota bacterium]MDW8363570.1 hypothetical protein [Myxococcales bacterium]
MDEHADTFVTGAPAVSGALRTGTVLGERYEIVEALETDPLVRDYRALDHETEQHVVVHVPASELVGSLDEARAFVQRLQEASGAGGRHLLPVLDADREGMLVYWIEPWLPEATTLRDVIAARAARGARIEPHELLFVLAQLVAGLDALPPRWHHGDVRAERILVDPERVRLAGALGLAAVSSSRLAAAIQSHANVRRRVAPEARRGAGSAAADRWSTAYIVFEALYGWPADVESDSGLLRPTHGLLGEALAAALSADPARRPTSLRPLLEALAAEARLEVPDVDPAPFRLPRRVGPSRRSERTEPSATPHALADSGTDTENGPTEDATAARRDAVVTRPEIHERGSSDGAATEPGPAALASDRDARERSESPPPDSRHASRGERSESVPRSSRTSDRPAGRSESTQRLTPADLVEIGLSPDVRRRRERTPNDTASPSPTRDPAPRVAVSDSSVARTAVAQSEDELRTNAAFSEPPEAPASRREVTQRLRAEDIVESWSVEGLDPRLVRAALASSRAARVSRSASGTNGTQEIHVDDILDVIEADVPAARVEAAPLRPSARGAVPPSVLPDSRTAPMHVVAQPRSDARAPGAPAPAAFTSPHERAVVIAPAPADSVPVDHAVAHAHPLDPSPPSPVTSRAECGPEVPLHVADRGFANPGPFRVPLAVPTPGRSHDPDRVRKAGGRGSRWSSGPLIIVLSAIVAALILAVGFWIAAERRERIERERRLHERFLKLQQSAGGDPAPMPSARDMLGSSER